MRTSIYIVLALISCAYCRTVRTVLHTCDSVERKIIGERLFGGSIRGRIICRYQPMDTSYALAIRLNKLNLERQGSSCPTLTLIGYTSLMKENTIDEDGRQQITRAVMVPSDPEKLAVIDCNNYKSKIGTTIFGKILGQKVELQFNAKTSMDPREDSFDIMFTSYRTGSSYRCPDDHFGCWSARYMCINRQLVCDAETNCDDNSDEEGYRCTGMVAGIKLPVFIIVIILALVLLVGIIIGVIFYQRRQAHKKAELKRRREAGMDMDPRSGQTFLDPQTPRDYSAYHPES